MGFTVNRPVVIKAIVTESFKRLYIQDLEEAIKRVNAIEGQLDSQIRRAELERTVTPQARAIRQQLELEVRVGDNLFTKLSRAEIIVKDGIIMEIREE